MPTNFPTGVDNFTNPTANDSLNLPSHSTQHANANDAIEAVETFLLNGGQGMTLVKKQTVGTGVSSVSVTDAFSSTYANYKIIYTGGVSTAQDDIRFSLNGITTGYYSSLIYVIHGSTTVLGASQQNQNNIQWLGGTTGANVYFDCSILNPNIARPKLVNGYFVQQTNAGAAGTTSGWINSTTQATAFTLTPVSGTWTGGTVYVYGYGIGQ